MPLLAKNGSCDDATEDGVAPDLCQKARTDVCRHAVSRPRKGVSRGWFFGAYHRRLSSCEQSTSRALPKLPSNHSEAQSNFAARK
jgi:hypothetical protein